MSDAKLKAKLNSTVAAWVKESGAATKSSEKRNALARQYHFEYVDVVADDHDFSPFAFVCGIEKARATKDSPFDAPKESELSEKKWGTLRARRDEMAAVSAATIKAGADTVKALWPETGEGVRATSREAFYDRCRSIRDAVTGDNRDAAQLIADSVAKRKAAAEEKAKEKARKLLGDQSVGGISIATLTAEQLADAIGQLAMRALAVGSPVASELMALAQRQKGDGKPQPQPTVN